MTATGYTRQSAATIVTGNTIQASDFNNEYNQLQSFASGTVGHDHSGGTGLGPQINLTTGVSGVLPQANGGTGSTAAQFSYIAVGGTISVAPTVPASGLLSMAIGDSSSVGASSTSSVAINGGAIGTANYDAIAIGIGATTGAGATDCIALGNSYVKGASNLVAMIGDHGGTKGITSVSASYSICIGQSNKITGGGQNVVVLGGSSNSYTANSSLDTIIGGQLNTISASSSLNTIIGGLLHTMSSTTGSTVLIGGQSTVCGNGTSYGTAINCNQCTFGTGASAATMIGSLTSTIQGSQSVIIGGTSNVTTLAAAGAIVLGGLSAKATINSQICGNSSALSVAGDNQWGLYHLVGQTTNNTQTEIKISGSSRCVLISNSTWTFEALITARRTDSHGNVGSWIVTGIIDNNAGTVTLPAAITKTLIYRTDSAWDVDMQADNTNKALILKVTGNTGQTINWGCTIRTQEVAG